MKQKIAVYYFCALLLLANSSNAQIVFDSTDAYFVKVNRSLVLCGPLTNHCLRFSYNASEQSFTFEYPGTTHKETCFNDLHRRSILDTLAEKPYPYKEAINWGDAQKIDLRNKAKLNPGDVVLLNKIYNRTDNVFFCSHQDIDDDGNNELIVIRKDKEFRYMLPTWRKEQTNSFFILDVFTFRNGTYTKKYHLGYESDITEIYLSHAPGSKTLNFLYFEIYSKESGSFQIAIDTVRW